MREVCVASEFDRGLHDMSVELFSSVEIRVVEVVAHEKRFGSIVFNSSLVSRQGGDSIPAGIMEIARVGVAGKACVGDGVGVWVGYRWGVACIYAFSTGIVNDFVVDLPFGVSSCSLGICSLQPGL